MHGRVWGHLQRRPRRPCPRGAEGWRQGCPSAHQAAVAPGFVKGFLPSLGLGTASRLQLSRGHSHSEWSDSPSLWTGLGSQSPQERSSLNSRSRAVCQIPLTPRHDRIPAQWKTRGRLHCSCGKSGSARAMRARPASVLAEAPRHQGRLGLQSSSQLPLIPLPHSQIASTQTALPCAPRLGLERRQWPSPVCALDAQTLNSTHTGTWRAPRETHGNTVVPLAAWSPPQFLPGSPQ